MRTVQWYDFATVESSAGVCHTIFRTPQPIRRAAKFGFVSDLDAGLRLQTCFPEHLPPTSCVNPAAFVAVRGCLHSLSSVAMFKLNRLRRCHHDDG